MCTESPRGFFLSPTSQLGAIPAASEPKTLVDTSFLKAPSSTCPQCLCLILLDLRRRRRGYERHDHHVNKVERNEKDILNNQPIILWRFCAENTRNFQGTRGDLPKRTVDNLGSVRLF